VRIEIAREYLVFRPDEYDLLYTKNIVTISAPGHLLLRTLYGFNSDIVDGKNWATIVLEVRSFFIRAD